MKILVINSGSSSIKYELFDMEGEKVLTKGLIERIGESSSSINHVLYREDGERKTTQEITIPDHKKGLKEIAKIITSKSSGAVENKDEIAAVGHRVVHGGEAFHETVVITDEVKRTVKSLIPLAPLHNPANIQGIEVAEEVFPNAKQVAVFDTAFHQTTPAKAHRYPIPNELYEKHNIRAYGFHGTSHKYVSREALEHLASPGENSAIITIHLGNGCSMAAIKGGKCIDTSMGLSPLAGLMMGTRSGDIDPSIPFFLEAKAEMPIQEIDKMLNKESGLKGITGSNDMRDILKKMESGDEQAKLGLDMFAYRIKKFIGAYAAALGKLDAIVFTAGIGENSAVIRELITSDLKVLGIEMDTEKNESDEKGLRELQTNDSKVKILVVPTNEELEIARQTKVLVGENYE
ncbi:MAG: acetate kinase [Bacteroidota bacterium]